MSFSLGHSDALLPQFYYDVIDIPDRTYTVQVRKHRKSRINKKWRKRYGVKVVHEMSCYLYENNGVIKILAPPKVANKIREAIVLREMGMIDCIKFKIDGKIDKTDKRFKYMEVE